MMKAIKTSKRQWLEYVVRSAVENNTFDATVDWDGVWSDVSAEFPNLLPNAVDSLIEEEYARYIKHTANREEGLYYG